MNRQPLLRAAKRAQLTVLTMIAVAIGLSAATPAQAQFISPTWTVKTDCYFKITRTDGKKKSRPLLASRQSENYFANEDLIIHFTAGYFDGEHPVTATILIANKETRKVYPMMIKIGDQKPQRVYGGQVELNKDMDFKLLTETPYGPVTATCSYF